MSADDVELQPTSRQRDLLSGPQTHHESTEITNENEGFSLPPTDGGKDAWLFLFACFMLEGMIWGFPASYGIFQEYYSTHEPFAGSRNLAVVGTCAMGIMYMDLALIFQLFKWFPRLRVWATPAGILVMCLALGLASLSTQVSHLVITQGIIYAIGGGFAWTPILFFIEEWWVRRRGFAYGVMLAGMGLSGAVLPVVLEWLLHRYGFRTTLRAMAITLGISIFPLLFVFKPRLPVSQATQSRSFDMSFWKCPTYLILQSGNVLQGLGYFLPAIYLPTFARSVGASNWESIATIILLNGAAFVGCLLMGLAVDRYHVSTCLFISGMISTVGVFLLWGLSTTLPVLYVFCVVYGAFSGCYASSWSAIIRDTRQKARGADPGMIFASLSVGKGIGNMCSGPLSEALLHAGGWKAGMAYGSGYGPLIVFTGCTTLLGGWSILARTVGLL